MKKITLQDIFDKAWKKFVVECGEPSTNNGVTCMYRTTVDNEVRNCAVGLALSDEQINQIKGNPTFSALYDCQPDWFDINTKLSLDTFQNRLHDDLIRFLGKPRYIEDIRNQYLLVAKDYNLKVPE